jgi:LacI family transcriptional regulator, galactose operon repressor
LKASRSPEKNLRTMNVREVAKRAGVSAATVSRALNAPELLSEETRRRVLRIIKDTGFYPNINARALFTATNRTLGVIVSNIANPYFLDIFRGIETRAHKRGYELLLANTDYDPDRLTASVRLMLGRRVAGLAVVVSEIDQALVAELARSNMRVVFSGVDTSGTESTNVKVNCRKGMEKVLTYLFALGHRRMAFVGHHASLESITERSAAFSQGVKGFGSRFESLIFADSDSIAGGRQAARDIINSGFQPTAIVCVNDVVAIGVLKELRERGIKVPNEISVTGFDNIDFAEACSPALTTVDISRERIAECLFQSLDRPLGSITGVREIVIDPQLVLRESTGPALTRVHRHRSSAMHEEHEPEGRP